MFCHHRPILVLKKVLCTALYTVHCTLSTVHCTAGGFFLHWPTQFQHQKKATKQQITITVTVKSVTKRGFHWWFSFWYWNWVSEKNTPYIQVTQLIPWWCWGTWLCTPMFDPMCLLDCTHNRTTIQPQYCCHDLSGLFNFFTLRDYCDYTWAVLDFSSTRLPSSRGCWRGGRAPGRQSGRLDRSPDVIFFILFLIFRKFTN